MFREIRKSAGFSTANLSQFPVFVGRGFSRLRFDFREAFLAFSGRQASVGDRINIVGKGTTSSHADIIGTEAEDRLPGGTYPFSLWKSETTLRWRNYRGRGEKIGRHKVSTWSFSTRAWPQQRDSHKRIIATINSIDNGGQ